MSDDLAYGWTWTGRLVDTADFEWKTWTQIYSFWLRFVAFQILINQILKTKFPKCVIPFNIAISFLWLCSTIGLKLSLVTFLQPLILLLIFQLLSLTFVWATCMSFIFVLHSRCFPELKVKYVVYINFYIFELHTCPILVKLCYRLLMFCIGTFG